MFYSDSFETVNGIHIKVKPFNNYQLHRHEFYEFEYVIEGEGQCQVNGKNFSFFMDLIFNIYFSKSHNNNSSLYVSKPVYYYLAYKNNTTFLLY